MCIIRPPKQVPARLAAHILCILKENPDGFRQGWHSMPALPLQPPDNLPSMIMRSDWAIN
jgi:hypothetical protein